jgi:large conductance mechanosensitive channel
MSLVQEFKAFAMRGNVIDMAVGIVIGGAFGKIVSSLVADVIMPLVGLAMGKISFVNLFVALNGEAYPSLEAAKAAGASTVNYGLFIQAIVDFTIVAFALFMVIKAMNTLKRKEAVAPTPAATPADVLLLTEIRDLLKK